MGQHGSVMNVMSRQQVGQSLPEVSVGVPQHEHRGGNSADTPHGQHVRQQIKGRLDEFGKRGFMRGLRDVGWCFRRGRCGDGDQGELRPRGGFGGFSWDVAFLAESGHVGTRAILF